MSVKASFMAAMALTAGITVYQSAHAQSPTAASDLPTADANACLAKLDRPENLSKLHPVESVGEVVCYKSRPAGACSVSIEKDYLHGKFLGISGPGEKEFENDLSFQFTDSADALVSINASNSGIITHIYIIPTDGSTPYIQNSESIDLNKIRGLAPQDRKVINDWLNYGRRTVCEAPIV